MLADISGYTRFMLDHEKAVAHGQMVIGTLLETLLEQVKSPLAFSKLEGDAIFLYAPLDDGSPDLRASLTDRIAAFFGEFDAALSTMASTAICRCGACANIRSLRLKVLVHSGEALLTRLGDVTELAGIDVIVVHRLLKNAIPSNEYLLLTDPARDVVTIDGGSLVAHDERYDDLGTIRTWLLAGDRVPRDCPTCGAPGASGLAYRILRHEITKEYREVARHPEKGFHFHTGQRLARMLGYRDEQIESVPARALESFAGTGNPHALGAIPEGAHVVDVGCGAGFDTLIAARAVGSAGHVISLDMTDDMIRKARAAVQEAGARNVTVVQGYVENLPVPDAWADVVISNGVLNLCPDKPAALGEMHRVLKPGGALQVGDILVEKAVPESAKGDLDLWTG